MRCYNISKKHIKLFNHFMPVVGHFSLSLKKNASLFDKYKFIAGKISIYIVDTVFVCL